MNLLVLTSEIR